ncbi:hypothetical protein OXX69_006897 [Metschnikowia pulcherrima]
MTEMTPVSKRLSIRYLDGFSEGSASTQAPAAAPESFQKSASAQKSHSHSKEKVEQNESSNDASNETSDAENGQKPLTSQNLAEQNSENEVSETTTTSGPVTSSITSPPTTGEDSSGKQGMSTEATSTSSEQKDVLPKKFFCKVCNQGFTRKHNMVSHEMIHTTIKVHRCQSCNLSFRRIHDLKRHEKLHSGEKPYHCENCDRSFARPDALTRHLNSPHACSGAKDGDDSGSAQRTQTSNTSSSSYQASKLKEAIQAAESMNHELPHKQTAPGPLPSLGNTFNEEQSIPLGSASSSASMLPTGKQASASDADSGAISSGADRPTLPNPAHASTSTMGYYAAPNMGFNSHSHDFNQGPRPNIEINKWRSQQQQQGESASENIVRGLLSKQVGSTNPTSVNSNSIAEDAKEPAQVPGIVPQSYPESSGQQYYRSYSPYHRSSASMNSMATLNKAAMHHVHGMGRNPSISNTMPNPAASAVTHTETRPGLAGHTFGSSLGDTKGSSSDSNYSQNSKENITMPIPSFMGNFDSHTPQPQQHQQQQQQQQYMTNSPMMHSSYNNGSSRSYLPVVSGQETWRNASHMQQPGNMPRQGSSGPHSWFEGNNGRPEFLEQREAFNPGSDFVRAEAYYELQSHASNLQMRVSSLEQRMEMLEEKLRKDMKSTAKLQKRQDKKAKRKSKKIGSKSP